ncbi:MAG: hypothetical protein ACXVKI_04480, partial [Flavisolibacter sp.]
RRDSAPETTTTYRDLIAELAARYRLPVVYSFRSVVAGGGLISYGPDTSDYRNYNFGGGLEGKMEETINMGKWGTLGFTAFYYWIHTYNGSPGNSLVAILKPTVAFRLCKNFSLGFEQLLYHNDRYIKEVPTLHLTRTEQKLYLQFFFENRQRTGKYH